MCISSICSLKKIRVFTLKASKGMYSVTVLQQMLVVSHKYVPCHCQNMAGWGWLALTPLVIRQSDTMLQIMESCRQHAACRRTGAKTTAAQSEKHEQSVSVLCFTAHVLAKLLSLHRPCCNSQHCPASLIQYMTGFMKLSNGLPDNRAGERLVPGSA